jgi:hypothetical protein
MPKKPRDIFKMDIVFAKSLKAKETNLLKAKIEEWLQKEEKNLPFDESKFKKKELTLLSDPLFFLASFKKKVKIIVAAKDPEKTLEKLNDTCNKIFSYLNTIKPDSINEFNVLTQFMLTETRKATIVKKLVGDSEIAKFSELVKAQVNPVGILLEWKEKSRHYIVFEADSEERDLILFSDFKWRDSIPIDSIISEKGELLKFKELINKLSKSGD